MTNSPQVNPTYIAKFYAEKKLNDHFGSSNLNILNFLEKDIVLYLNDFFIITRDLSITLNEEFRRCYFDYSFAVVPVHKAFETYLNRILILLFEYEITKEPQKTVGHYLNLSNAEKSKKLEETEREMNLKLNKPEWLSRWNALSDHWKKNRNPLTHSGEERIETLTKAEQVANSIIREINLSLKLFTAEFIDPLLTRVKEQEDKKIEEEKKKHEVAMKILKEKASGIN